MNYSIKATYQHGTRITGRATRSSLACPWNVYLGGKLVAQLYGTVHEMKREVKAILKPLGSGSKVAIRALR